MKQICTACSVTMRCTQNSTCKLNDIKTKLINQDWYIVSMTINKLLYHIMKRLVNFVCKCNQCSEMTSKQFAIFKHTHMFTHTHTHTHMCICTCTAMHNHLHKDNPRTRKYTANAHTNIQIYTHIHAHIKVCTPVHIMKQILYPITHTSTTTCILHHKTTTHYTSGTN